MTESTIPQEPPSDARAKAALAHLRRDVSELMTPADYRLFEAMAACREAGASEITAIEERQAVLHARVLACLAGLEALNGDFPADEMRDAFEDRSIADQWGRIAGHDPQEPEVAP
ncbi:hypothetical protein [Rhodospirillum sp. A1_3_36]|uniref:hypothetical protein n=1 Tax=Rhodospirillum sp. A1_3_36 TaxID=3391666 RepID=UPI0039A7149A